MRKKNLLTPAHLLILGSILCCLACVPRRTTPPPISAHHVWNHFLLKTKQPCAPALRLKGNFYFFQGNKGERLKFLLWGNNNYPYRILLCTPFGNVVAQLLVEQNRAQIYIPGQKKLFLFNLNQGNGSVPLLPGLNKDDFLLITLVMTQRWSLLNLLTEVTQIHSSKTVQGDALCFSARQPKFPIAKIEKKIAVSKICLNRRSLPVTLQGTSANPWTAHIAYNAQTHLPSEITISAPLKKIVFKVKKYSFLKRKFGPKELELQVPAGTLRSNLELLLDDDQKDKNAISRIYKTRAMRYADSTLSICQPTRGGILK